ncbi:MAG TPA: hypothetical protein VH120_13430, partial [Gemmataceae bacterium]|nr:hypothetical protein [Gemmataceae bacterium]
MTLRWRIRHKLLLGLGVVAGIIVLLLGSTLYGLAAFTATVKTAESKVTELHHAELLKQQVSYLRSMTADPGRTLDGLDVQIRAKVTAAREAVDSFAEQMRHSIERGREVDKGDYEEKLVEDLYRQLKDLDAAVAHLTSGFSGMDSDDSLSAVRSGVSKLDESANRLCQAVNEDLYGRL